MGYISWDYLLSLTVSSNIILGWMGDKIAFAELSRFPWRYPDRCRWLIVYWVPMMGAA